MDALEFRFSARANARSEASTLPLYEAKSIAAGGARVFLFEELGLVERHLEPVELLLALVAGDLGLEGREVHASPRGGSRGRTAVARASMAAFTSQSGAARRGAENGASSLAILPGAF